MSLFFWEIPIVTTSHMNTPKCANMESGGVFILGIPTLSKVNYQCMKMSGSKSFTRIEMFGDVQFTWFTPREIKVSKLHLIFSNCGTASCPASWPNLLQQKSLTTRTACASRGVVVCEPLEAWPAFHNPSPTYPGCNGIRRRWDGEHLESWIKNSYEQVTFMYIETLEKLYKSHNCHSTNKDPG